MFELSLALRYLIPRGKSLSRTLISVMSIFVISLVTWLVLIFLSVTSGIEKNWLQKLTSLHAPVRIAPTKAYYQSYFYQIDSFSIESNYTNKTIGEKRESLLSNPYNPALDPSLPSRLPLPAFTHDGSFLDPVKSLEKTLTTLQIPDLTFQDYEISGALMRLSLQNKGFLSQMTYLLSIPDENPRLRSLILPMGQIIDFDNEPQTPPSYVHFVNGKVRLPELDPCIPAILPKTYLDHGAKIGDQGVLSYMAPALASQQEQRLPFQVVGFYDPGILSMGHKCILIPSSATRDLYHATQTFSPDGTPTNGIFVWTPSLSDAKSIQKKIQQALEKNQLSPYWEVTTYEDFEFSKDLLRQFQSDRTLLLLIAAIILIVACSNIISLLTLLVNDKKKEIAILMAMGSSFKSIATIFAMAGMIMGLVSCLLGSLLAFFTLRHLASLIHFLSFVQGREAFHPSFFGSSLPNEFSMPALLFIFIITPILSLLAGLIPALKASKIRPSSILRSE